MPLFSLSNLLNGVVKGAAKPLNGIQSNGLWNMQVMLRHIHAGVPYDALDGREVHSQRLYLTDIGMSAAVRRKQTHRRNGLQCLTKLVF